MMIERQNNKRWPWVLSRDLVWSLGMLFPEFSIKDKEGRELVSCRNQTLWIKSGYAIDGVTGWLDFPRAAVQAAFIHDVLLQGLEVVAARRKFAGMASWCLTKNWRPVADRQFAFALRVFKAPWWCQKLYPLGPQFLTRWKIWRAK